MLIIKSSPISKFFIMLGKDLDALNTNSPDFKYLTVENAAELHDAASLSKRIESLEVLAYRCQSYYAEHNDNAAEIINDICLNKATDMDALDEYERRSPIDVRKMLDNTIMQTNLDKLINLFILCETNMNSTLYRGIIENALVLLWSLYTTTQTALTFFGNTVDSADYVKDFLAAFSSKIVIDSTMGTSLGDRNNGDMCTDFHSPLRFIRHDGQVVFNEQEQEAIHAEEVRAEEARLERERLDGYKAEVRHIQTDLEYSLGISLGPIQTIADCKKIQALHKILISIIAYLNPGKQPPEDSDAVKKAYKEAYELLKQVIDDKAHSDAKVYFTIDKITPFSINYWLKDLFGGKLEATFVTSMEVITSNPQEVYHYDENSMVAIAAVT